MTYPDQPLPIEDYAILGDLTTAALVGRNGSVDWLCWPRFDSGACLAALLGTPENGRWLLAPAEGGRAERRYLDGGLVLESRFATPAGEVAVTEFMVPDQEHSTLVRIVRGLRGSVPMRSELTLRFDYGDSVPWVTRLEGADGQGVRAVAGPSMAVLRTPIGLRGEDMATVAEFTVAEGDSVPFVLAYGPSHLPPPPPLDATEALDRTERFWRDWSGRCPYRGGWEPEVRRSLLALKALTYAPTGGIVAAATTSLPEQPGGVRNWDYRFCWLRDATLTLMVLMAAGYTGEAQAWSDWLERSVAGSPEQVRIMYGIAGERRLEEWEVPWLAGYGGAKPVRIGNAASTQLQLDVYGEVADAFHQARMAGLLSGPHSWSMQRAMLDHLEEIWETPDSGLWETRGGDHHFTFSKVMAWVAFDRAIQDAEQFTLPGPVDRWRTVRDAIHAQVCARGYHAGVGHFVQHYDTDALDASLLLIGELGFLPWDDPRVRRTVEAVERDLVADGFVLRYRTEGAVDGLPTGEGAFLACSFWLATALHAVGRTADARTWFEKLVALCNDVGLLAEEYDPVSRRQLGNFPQAFSHLALIGAAMRLSDWRPERGENTPAVPPEPVPPDAKGTIPPAGRAPAAPGAGGVPAPAVPG